MFLQLGRNEMAEIEDREQLEIFLRNQPRELSAVIAVRCALRVLPCSVWFARPRSVERAEKRIILSSLRAMAASLNAIKYPASDEAFSRSGGAAIRAIGSAEAVRAAGATRTTVYAIYAAHAARAAVYAALAVNDAVRSTAAAGDAAEAAHAAAEATGIAEGVRASAWEAINADLASGGENGGLARLWTAPLWQNAPKEMLKLWQTMKLDLEAGNNWASWLEWYEDVLYGRPVWSLTAHVAEELEVRIFTQAEEWWGRDVAEVNADIAAWVDAAKLAVARATAAEATSPEPTVDDQGRLDVASNDRINQLLVDEDIHKLPERQRRIIKNLIAAVEPTNAPRLFGQYLESYLSELDLGFDFEITHLKDDFAVIDALCDQEEAPYWFGDAGEIVKQFKDVHQNIISHYPLDLAREETINNAPLDGSIMDSEAFKNAHAELTAATVRAVEEGLATEAFKEVVERTGRQLRDIASLESRPTSRISELSLTESDRIVPADVRKRFLFQIGGFSDKALQRTANMTTIADSETGRSLVSGLGDVVNIIWKSVFGS